MNANTNTNNTTTGTAENTAGPHSGRLANAHDPHVDSDIDGSARLAGTNTYNNAGTTSTTGPTGATTNNANTIPTSKTTTNPIKAAAAAVHGAGEVVRGTFNSAVEGAFNESGGIQKNDAITSAGIDEIETGRFSQATKNREGVVSGSDHGVQRV